MLWSSFLDFKFVVKFFLFILIFFLELCFLNLFLICLIMGFIFASVFLSSMAQLFLKYWLDGKDFVFSSYQTFIPLFYNIFIWLWLISYWLSMLLWLRVLSLFDVSFAYPFVSLSFVIVLIWGFFFGETISLLKIGWVILILLWIFCIVKW